MTQAPWWTFPRIDNFGQIDPQGNYYKPDTNVLTPYGYPVIAGVPGTVTSVQRTSYGQSVVTIRLDNPINGLATHTFFEHMHDATVATGQHVDSGTQIGDANYSGEGANLGFGLYSGDVYGTGPAWAILQQDLAPGGAGQLNPVPLINNLKMGISPITSGATTTGSSNASTSASWSTAIPDTLMHIGLILIAFLLVAAGLYAIFQKQIDSGVQKGVQAAKLAVLA